MERKDDTTKYYDGNKYCSTSYLVELYFNNKTLTRREK
jgi:hypothetical protein